MGGMNPRVALDDANLEPVLDCAICGTFCSTARLLHSVVTVDRIGEVGSAARSSKGPSEQGCHASELYTTVKTVYVHP
jgi:hypothetical protein